MLSLHLILTHPYKEYRDLFEIEVSEQILTAYLQSLISRP